MFQTDRFIKIYVGQQTKPYLIQQTLLTNASEYFARAIANEDSFGGEKGTLRFPEDDENTWCTVLDWKIKGQLCFQSVDSNSDAAFLVKLWAHGDKYGCKNFQDEVMRSLLDVIRPVHLELHVHRAAFENTPPGSALRRLMAEDMALSLIRNEFNHGELDMFDGIVGFATDFVDVVQRRVVEDRSDLDFTWDREQMKSLMVGDAWKTFA